MFDRSRAATVLKADSGRSAALALELSRRGARFVVVGGTARRILGHLGPPHDLDLAVLEDDLPALVMALADLGVAVTVGRLARGRTVSLCTSYGPLDVFVRAHRQPAFEVSVGGVILAVDPAPEGRS